jgi:ADP-ribose pyrophosphatase YjhB (NUDIX family)
MDYLHEAAFKDIEKHLRAEYREVIIDFIIIDPKTNKILTQKRAADRRLFPGVWEFPGSLLQPHESLTACIQRTMHEECQMRLKQIHSLVHVFTWDEDRDVATAQFLVEGTGTYAPQADMVSDWQYIGRDEIGLLLTDGQTPIHRGAWYAFSYLDQPKAFATVLFFDKIISEFFVHLGIMSAAPRVRLGECKRFAIDTADNVLTVAPDFVDEYGVFAAANIVLHQLYHNHRQGIATYQSVQAIRKLFGANFMFYVDIVADVYTYLFLHARYGYSERDYLEMCFDSIPEYQSDTIEQSKCSRLLGTALSIRFSNLATCQVVLPVIDSGDARLAILHFDKQLQYRVLPVSATAWHTLQALFTGGKASRKQYLQVIQQLTDTYQKDYTS